MAWESFMVTWLLKEILIPLVWNFMNTRKPGLGAEIDNPKWKAL